MRRTKTLTLDSTGDIEVSELTVGEIRNWMRDLSDRDAPTDIVDSMLMVEIRLSDLQRLTDLTDANLDKLTQSELNTLMEAIQELNPSFFAMLGRLAEAGERLLQAAPVTSSAAPAS